MIARAVDLSPKTGLFPHQAEAVSFILGKPAVAIFDEQGLGKTKIVLDALTRELKVGTIEGALIICRAGLIPTWQDEIEKHTHLKASVLSGDRKRIGRSYLVFSPIYLAPYSLLHREIQAVRDLLQLKRFAMVLDESHTIKNPTAQVTLTIFAVSPLSVQRIILTGTPVANYPEDLWAQFYFLDQGATLGDDFEQFRIVNRLGTGAKRRSVPKSSLDSIIARIRPITMRRTKKDVLELPDKSFESKRVRLVGEQARIYNQLRDELRLELLGSEGQLETLDIENVLERLLRLVQVASNPALIDPRFAEIPVKFRLLDRLLRSILSRGEKAIVWSQFVENVETLHRQYKVRGAVKIHGGIAIEQRHRAVTRFQEDPECRLLFAVPAAAREGLTLTAANNAIYIDRSFNLVDYLQSQDRIHRIGQTQPCLVQKIIAEKTVDEFVDDVLNRKASIAETVQSGVGTDREVSVVRSSDIVRVLGGGSS